MTDDINIINARRQQFMLLTNILDAAHYNVPAPFALKLFLGWNDATIKTFLKEQKKLAKKKKRAPDSPTPLGCPTPDNCCGGGCGA